MDGSQAVCDAHGHPLGSAFFAQSSFGTYAIATERNAIKIRSDVPLELMGPLGCGIQTGGASAIILLPDETLQQAKNTAASALFASNIYFYTQFDYFDASSEFNALLHTWSLSVEEQFYIFFPPLLAFVHRRFPAALKPLVGFILVITLILSQWRLATDPSAAFYLVQYRKSQVEPLHCRAG